MNRNQRKCRTPNYENKPNNDTDASDFASKLPTKDVESLLPPRPKVSRTEISMNNRCCYVAPEKRSFAQITEPELDTIDWHQNQLYDSDFDPLNSESVTVKQLNDLKRLVYGLEHRVEIGSQYTHPVDELYSVEHFGRWKNFANGELGYPISRLRDEETITNYHNLPKNIYISDVPRVKVIAQKYHKYKHNDIELRKLDEKVFCVEYDVFDKSDTELAEPLQVMRAFFAFKPEARHGNTLTERPSTFKNKFNIQSLKMDESEIEIMDSMIAENRPYLQDLRKILQKPKRKEKKPLNLQTLYHMANREYLNLHTEHTNVLSKKELRGFHKMHKLLSLNSNSVHGISRKAVKNSDQTPTEQNPVISQTIINELMKED